MELKNIAKKRNTTTIAIFLLGLILLTPGKVTRTTIHDKGMTSTSEGELPG